MPSCQLVSEKNTCDEARWASGHRRRAGPRERHLGRPANLPGNAAATYRRHRHLFSRCELRHVRSQVRKHDADADKPVTDERAERSPTRIREPLALVSMVRDRVLALTLARPRRRAELAVHRSGLPSCTYSVSICSVRSISLTRASSARASALYSIPSEVCLRYSTPTRIPDDTGGRESRRRAQREHHDHDISALHGEADRTCCPSRATSDCWASAGRPIS